MAHSKLSKAKKAKNDEFYTQYCDIEKEMNAYIEYNPDVFRGKIILSPCDDPATSNFTKYFAQNFEALGLKKYISTSYSNSETIPGKIYIITDDNPGGGTIKIEDIHPLVGNGDYRSEEVTKLRDEADMIITNPPFSLFRDFMKWMMEGGAD